MRILPPVAFHLRLEPQRALRADLREKLLALDMYNLKAGQKKPMECMQSLKTSAP